MSTKDVGDTIAKAAGLLSAAANLSRDRNLSNTAGSLATLGNLARDPVGTTAAIGLNKLGASAPVIGGVMGGINADKHNMQISEGVVSGLAQGWAAKALFTANPLIGSANLISGAVGGPTVGGLVQKGIDAVDQHFGISDNAKAANSFNEGVQAISGTDPGFSVQDARNLGPNMDGDSDGSFTNAENARLGMSTGSGWGSSSDGYSGNGYSSSNSGSQHGGGGSDPG